jgi:RNA polymerase sigma factor (sigma-70 family)
MYKPDSPQEYLSQNIKLFCETNKLSYRDLGILLDVSESTLRNWIQLRGIPDDTRKKFLERLFGASFDKICSNIMSVKLMMDHIYTIEDIFPYNCIISASLGYNVGSYLADDRENPDEDFNVDYRNVTPAEFDTILQARSYREQLIIEMRYRDSYTLEEVGKKLGITRERVRQIEYRTLRIIKNQIGALLNHKAELKQLKLENIKLRAYIDSLPPSIEKPTIVSVKDDNLILDKPIDDLELSSRSYNALLRSGYRTISDLVTSKRRLDQLRCIGVRSLEEIIAKVEELDIPYKYDPETKHFVRTTPQELPPYRPA